MSSLHKKVIIIGASSGIGEELFEMYIGNGFDVGIASRDEYSLNNLKNKYPNRNIKICKFDIRDHKNTKVCMEKLILELGGVDLFINSAGVGFENPALRFDLELETINTNVVGFTCIIDFFYEYFLQTGFGHIAVITSISSIRGDGTAPAYSASKSYQVNYLEALRKKIYTSKKDIFLTDICPGYIDTKMAISEKLFWVTPRRKAALQIYKAISNKKTKAYISRRWWLIAVVLKLLPDFIYYKL